MGFPEAATALNHLIAASTSLEVALGEAKFTSSKAREPRRPYVRLIYQGAGEPTAIPGRLEGLLSIFCYAESSESAWAHGAALMSALGLEREHHRKDTTRPELEAFWLDSGWNRLPDPSGGGLILASIGFHYH